MWGLVVGVSFFGNRRLCLWEFPYNLYHYHYSTDTTVTVFFLFWNLKKLGNWKKKVGLHLWFHFIAFASFLVQKHCHPHSHSSASLSLAFLLFGLEIVLASSIAGLIASPSLASTARSVCFQRQKLSALSHLSPKIKKKSKNNTFLFLLHPCYCQL